MRAQRGLTGLVAGLLVWSACFVTLYGLHAVGCAADWHEPGRFASPLRIALVLAWLLHLAALGWLIARYCRPAPADDRTGGFLRLAAGALSLIALAATLWTGAPVVLLELCV